MIDRTLLRKLVCVGLVAAVMVPLGSAVFPYIGGDLSGLQFRTLEAMVGATFSIGMFAMFG